MCEELDVELDTGARVGFEADDGREAGGELRFEKSLFRACRDEPRVNQKHSMIWPYNHHSYRHSRYPFFCSSCRKGWKRKSRDTIPATPTTGLTNTSRYARSGCSSRGRTSIGPLTLAISVVPLLLVTCADPSARGRSVVCAAVMVMAIVGLWVGLTRWRRCGYGEQ